jgi:integrating conjugative element protein (TIGR03761 family)
MAIESKPASPASPSVTAGSAPYLVPPAQKLEFATEHNSPFADGYSIKGEEFALTEFLAQEFMDESDPRYERYVELDERKDRLEKMQSRFQSRKGADPLVEQSEYLGLAALGSLVDEDVDQMSIHTKEAYRMFMGRTREPGKDVAPIIGGKRIAAALKALWLLTGTDNPYADWGLLRHEQSMAELHKRLVRETKEAEAMVAEQQKHGLRYSILKSASPKVLNLGFKSPYGYAVATLIVEFDYYVRLQKTMARKNLRSDDQVRQAITELTRFVRRVFNETARFDRWLMKDELQGLCRVDFVAGGAPDAIKRVEFASGVFGAIPSEVYTCKLQPRHSRRRMQISPAERKLLGLIGSELEKQEKEAELSDSTGKAGGAGGRAPKADAGLV